ncbi:MAG: copper amine oxidase N-terminal domain-containing protein [Clostridiaceae bacterium]|nr:copper amine oxidase N-terminal domain-containing protein [Clostridiaceae bacterium]
MDILYSNVYGSVFAGNSDTYVIATGEELPLSGNNAFIVGRSLGEKPVKVYLNGKKLNFDSVPVIENGRTLVPMRAIFEALGAEVTWDDRNKSVTCFKEKKSITLTIGNTQAVLNNEKYTLGVPPRIVNGRTLVPLRFISESLGTEVLWDAADRKVSITSK